MVISALSPKLTSLFKFSVADAIFYSLMIGLGETYFSAFTLALGFSAVHAAIIATVPLVIGGFIQLGTSWGLKRVNSYRKWCVFGVIFQSLCFFPLIFGAVKGYMSFFLLFIFVTIYWTIGMGIGPVWNTWLKTLIPKESAGPFFSKRSFYMFFAIMGAVVFSGLLLVL